MAIMTSEFRQEIAFLFFGLVLLVLFTKQLYPKFKKILFVIFGISMIVSHYSTSYIVLSVFLLTYFFTLIYGVYEDKKIKKEQPNKIKEEPFYLTGGLIILLLLFGFLWYSQITPTSNSLIDFIDNTVNNIDNLFSSDMRSVVVREIIPFREEKINTISILENYSLNKVEEYKIKGMNLFDQQTYENYKPFPSYSKSLVSSGYKIAISSLVSYKILAIMLKLFILIGILAFLIFSPTFYKNWNYYFIILLFFIFLSLIILLPYVSLRYDLDRMYLNSLFLLSFIQILGGVIFFDIIFKSKIRPTTIMSIILILFFLFSYGFLWQFFGTNTYFWLNNFGQTYDLEYVTLNEVLSAEWINANTGNIVIYADTFAKNNLIAFGNQTKIRKDVLPSTIEKNAIVYLDNPNTLFNLNFLYYNSNIISYNFPTKFIM